MDNIILFYLIRKVWIAMLPDLDLWVEMGKKFCRKFSWIFLQRCSKWWSSLMSWELPRIKWNKSGLDVFKICCSIVHFPWWICSSISYCFYFNDIESFRHSNLHNGMQSFCAKVSMHFRLIFCEQKNYIDKLHLKIIC